MRQIAVLPYRFGGVDKDGPTEILLVTSRGTGRGSKSRTVRRRRSSA
ncbi:MAG: hypothetical protein IBJ13_10850 [Sphingopyxis sp.]|nr:hypothetical protein [Sphingopyxis sp.]